MNWEVCRPLTKKEFCGTITAIGLNTTPQYRMIDVIESRDRVGMLPVNQISTFQIHHRVTERGFRRQTQMETGHQMCRTRYRTASRVVRQKPEDAARTAQSARTQTCSWLSLPSRDGAIYQVRSGTPKRTTMKAANSAVPFFNGLTKGQLLKLYYTSRFVYG